MCRISKHADKTKQKQSKTKQNKAEQNKTKQNEEKAHGTREDKMMQSGADIYSSYASLETHLETKGENEARGWHFGAFNWTLLRQKLNVIAAVVVSGDYIDQTCRRLLRPSGAPFGKKNCAAIRELSVRKKVSGLTYSWFNVSSRYLELTVTALRNISSDSDIDQSYLP